MENAWRAELRVALAAEGYDRPPVLRRSLLVDFLYAVDLPLFAPAEQVSRFQQRAEALGWECRREGWLQLRRAMGAPPAGWFAGPFGEEAACCHSLQRCHPPEAGEDALAGLRAACALIKAGEEGPAACERVFRALHRDWAVRLRLGMPLPRLHEGFFGAERDAPKEEGIPMPGKDVDTAESIGLSSFLYESG